jgi:hypothetical protein
MLTLLLYAQLAASASPERYASSALREFVARAAVENHAPPSSLQGYEARLASEIALVASDSIGREQALQIEQLALGAKWSRRGRYDLHVLGYRSQSVGAPFSAHSFVRSWTVPTLYGDRLDLGFEPTGRRRAARGRDSIHAVHPLASDRDGYYRYTGGDTVAVLRTVSGDVHIIRVHVTPTIDSSARVAAFEGDLDFDAGRAALVRMRGRFVVARPARSRAAAFLGTLSGVAAVAYAELVNALYEGEYWLPAYQRTELQAAFAAFGDSRSVFRIVTTFGGYTFDRADSVAIAAGASEAAPRPERALTFAPAESLSRFSEWSVDFGAATAAVSASDFADLEPASWRATGDPSLRFYPRALDEVARFDRVEGLYTGVAASLRLRDAFPGLSLRAFGGWAWSERTARGGAAATLDRGGRRLAVRAERALVSTNDFVLPFEGGSSISALLFSVDDRDFVDRRSVGAAFTQPLGSIERGLVTLEASVARDRAERRRLTTGPFGGSRAFRENRASADGDYALAALALELNPDVSGDFLHPGVGLRLRQEWAAGDLRWARTELSLSARAYWRSFLFAAHGDGGLLFGASAPPQKLFEIGSTEGLPGYHYKEFGGDRAILLRAMTGYSLPILRKPFRLWRDYVLPGLAPGIAAGVNGGWAEASTDAARQALAAFASADPTEPPPGPTHRIRATVDLRATLLGGGVSFGVARPVDHAARWRFVFAVGQTF